MSAESKVYEIRTYHCKPEEFQSFIRNTATPEYAIRLQVSHPWGIFRTEVGDLNAFFHVWGYESLEQRAKVRAELQGNPAWGEYYPNIAVQWLRQENSMATAEGPVLNEAVFTNGAYAYLLVPSTPMEQSKNFISELNNLLATSFKSSVVSLGNFRVFSGSVAMGSFYIVLNGKSQDAIGDFLKHMSQSSVQSDSKATLLCPLPHISPLK